ncbi:MAG: hypothetical protein mread185_000019 [Mycoplasmataceae bacterium]|nr:MAG: hypothetical protein mread185_000019 [Mycoplasmataceae bacterium]
MFNFPKNKIVFSKLYRYYCAKLLTKIWLVVFYFCLFVFMTTIQGFSSREYLSNAVNNQQSRLFFFWMISIFQLFALIYMVNPLVSYLVGRGLGWDNLKKGKLFQMPKISREEDVKVLTFTPSVDRETIIWAKFASIFTYVMGINLIFTLLGCFYFLLFANFGMISTCLFLLLNGIVLALVNFCLLVPFLFYQQEEGSFLANLLLSIFLFLLAFSLFLLRDLVQNYPIVFMIASVPFAILIGCFFFSAYWKSFLSKDLI